MSWATTMIGLFLILVLALFADAFPSVPWRSRRSIDLNDFYHLGVRQHRLPKEMIPASYHLELEPFIGNDKFRGRVKINVTWTDTSDTITLNAHPDLEISMCHVRSVEQSFEEKEKNLTLMNVNIARVNLPTARKRWFTVHLEQMLKKGSMCEVDISFNGSLVTNNSSGLFKSEYLDADGKTHPFVATRFKLDHAQSVFPCMDGPPYKAPFKLSLLRPKNMTARSNMPLESSTGVDDKPDLIWDHFEETPAISTDQLTLIVSDFESISPTLEIDEMDGRRLEIQVWGRKEYLESLKDVPDKVVKIINYLQEYFNSSIGLPKLDLMAVPSYNAAKASDNWGLMFFKESELSSTSVWNTAYEILYQWIGQYITPFHWSDAPVYKALNSFLASMTTVDINPDEMEGKWPMTMLYSLYYEFGKVVPFSRVAGIRNEATSAKTELVFRMFNYTLGKELFQKGVRNFIQDNSKENQRTFFANDIYTKLNDVAKETDILPQDLTINSIAGPWINRDRVPIVTMIRDCETKTIIFSQKVYLREAPRAYTPKASYEWDIPIILMTQDKFEFEKPIWFMRGTEPRNLTVEDVTDENHFVIANPEEIGMFPVNYDSCNWKMLSKFLQGPDREKIPVLTRAKLLHDSWNLAYSGELCFGIALNMTLFLKEERSHVVWEPVFMMLDHVGRRIEGTDVYPIFEAYIRTLMKPLYEELNQNIDSDEPSWKAHMRGMAKNFLCRAGYEPCVQEARDHYRKWLTDEDPDKGNPVANEFICPVFKWGTEEEWEFGLQRVINFPQNSPERKQNERTYLLKSLAGCPKDAYKIERLLNATILDPNGNFTDSDIQLILVTLSSGGIGHAALSNFLEKIWDILGLRQKTHLWQRVLKSLKSSFTTQENLDKLYQTNPEDYKNATDTLIQSIFRNERKLWNEKNLLVISSWLMENLPKEELQSVQNYAATTTIPPDVE